MPTPQRPGAAAPERVLPQPPEPSPTDPADRDASRPTSLSARITDRPVVRAGVYAWATLGLIGVAGVGLFAVGRLSVVIVPLVLALFPASLLVGPTNSLKARGMPPALAATIVLLAFLGVFAGLVSLLAPAVGSQIGQVGPAVQTGADAAQRFLRSGPFGLQPIRLDEIVAQAREQLTENPAIREGLFGAAVALAEGVTGLLLGLVALFFYLKDGPRIAAAVRDFFPERVRDDVTHIGELSWGALVGYIRGQSIIALVDAIGIGIGIAILGVPLLLPLSLLVFVGALFPIVGAVTAGTVAVLVALATQGVADALILLAIIIAVQQIEGHVLGPIVLARATQLHPLMTLSSLAAGAVLLGVLGAFVAVPLAASLARTVAYLRERTPG